MRVLVVEDDPGLSAAVCQALAEQGADPQPAASAAAALAVLGADAWDVVVLDWMLGPGADGLELCRRIRADGGRSRILMLTARDAVADRVRGLEAGADDYLVKPFALAELLARVRALGRRDGRAQPVMVVADLRVDALAHTVHAGGRLVSLTNREFDLLRLLVANAGAVLSKQVIHDHLWSHDLSGELTLVEVYMARLRAKLRDAGWAGVVTTIRNVGYRLERAGGSE